MTPSGVNRSRSTPGRRQARQPKRERLRRVRQRRPAAWWPARIVATRHSKDPRPHDRARRGGATLSPARMADAEISNEHLADEGMVGPLRADSSDVAPLTQRELEPCSPPISSLLRTTKNSEPQTAASSCSASRNSRWPAEPWAAPPADSDRSVGLTHRPRGSWFVAGWAARAGLPLQLAAGPEQK